MIEECKEDRCAVSYEYKKQVILADANIPYKLSVDRNKNNLFFCINADEFSEQSFHSVVLCLDTGLPSIIPGIRNGFASAVDQPTGDVYLGGSDGVFKYNYCTNDIDKPALVTGIDILDMFYKESLYFVDTASQNLYVYKNNSKALVSEVKHNLIQHFVIDDNGDIYFVNSSGLYVLLKGSRSPILIDDSDVNIRGATTDSHGVPFFIAQDGIYRVEQESKQLLKAIPIENGYGIAFDRDNNIIYSDERSVVKLGPY